MSAAIDITEPDQKLLNYAADVVAKFQAALPADTVELVGALAVPMRGRREVDVMIVTSDSAAATAEVESLGYNKGPIVNEIAYFRKYEGDIELGVQILPEGHKMINVHHSIISAFNKDEVLRKEYEELKASLSNKSKEEYSAAKKKWLVAHKLN